MEHPKSATTLISKYQPLRFNCYHAFLQMRPFKTACDNSMKQRFIDAVVQIVCSPSTVNGNYVLVFLGLVSAKLIRSTPVQLPGKVVQPSVCEWWQS